MKLIKSDPILAIDPGTTKSGVVLFDGESVLYSNAEMDNGDIIEALNIGCVGNNLWFEEAVIEEIKSYGMPMGDTTIQTIIWIGRFIEVWTPSEMNLLPRKTIVTFLCGSSRAKDSNVRRRILDLFPQTGGGKEPAIGTKPQPGPLYGVAAHSLSALAVGLTYKYREEETATFTG